MSKKIIYRVANEMKYDETLELLREFYYKEEPLTLSHPQPGHTEDDEEFTMSQIYAKTSSIAIDEATGKIVGALMAGPIEHGDPEKMIKDSENSETSKKWSDILKFLAYIEIKSNVLNKFNLDKAVHVQAIGVDRNYRGNKIGENLLKHCFENAKNLNYKLVSGDFTNISSIKVAENAGMELVSIVTYDEYNKSLGKNYYKCNEPNTQIKTFIKHI